MANADRIYMPLVDEGTDVWTPVRADAFGPGYRLVRSPIPSDELWAFPPDHVVAVTERAFSRGERGLVAVEGFGKAPPECDQLLDVRLSEDGLGRLCIFHRCDGLYQFREDRICAHDDTLPYWHEGHPLSGLYPSLGECIEDAPRRFRETR